MIFFKVIERFPIENIKRKKLINEVNTGDVLYMLLNFNKEAWMPITLNKLPRSKLPRY